MASFSCFSRLPSELRNQIWLDALPEKDAPALFFYKQGCWCSSSKPEPRSHNNEKLNGNESRIFQPYKPVFRHQLLDWVEVKVPLASVNREARTIALAWAQEKGVCVSVSPNEPSTGSNRDSQQYIFARPFDPDQDSVFVFPDQMRQYFNVLKALYFHPIGCSDEPFREAVSVTSFAFSKNTLQSEIVNVVNAFFWASRAQPLKCIADMTPTVIHDMRKALKFRSSTQLQRENDRTRSQHEISVHCRWELNEISQRRATCEVESQRVTFEDGTVADINYNNLFGDFDILGDKYGDVYFYPMIFHKVVAIRK